MGFIRLTCIGLLILNFFCIVSCLPTEDTIKSDLKNNEESMQTQPQIALATEQSTLISSPTKYSVDAFDNSTQYNAFVLACEETNINIENIKNVEKLENWAHGERYSFTYQNKKLLVYFNGNNSINSININDTKIYRDGFTALNIDNYTDIEKQIEESIEAKDKEIKLIDDVIGDYGKIVTVDSFEYIHYFLPTGEYKVVADTDSDLLFLDKNKYKKTAEGYSEAVNIQTIFLEHAGDETQIEIVEDSHILLGIGSRFTFIPVEKE